MSKFSSTMKKDRKESLFSRDVIDAPELPEEIASLAITSGDYPYDHHMRSKQYKRELETLQIELLKLQRHVRLEGQRLVIIFEGRDAAGKGGTIMRIMQHLNPRSARTVALAKPNNREHGEWYFQRYINRLPTSGEIVLFDRSWYNRAGVEPVMGFCTPEESARFLDEVPRFEEMLVRDGVLLIKFWLEVGREMQLKRLHARSTDPLKRWKLSPIDLDGVSKWHDFTAMRDRMFEASDGALTPWTVVRANDKRRLRLNVIRHILTRTDFAEKDEDSIGDCDSKIVLRPEEFLASLST